MAHLWVAEGLAGWSATPLAGDTALSTGVAQLVRATGDGAWVLVGPSAVRVNGEPLDAGIRVLRDRDELLVAGRRSFFSSETLAVVEPLPVVDRPPVCPRCKTAIEPGTLAVRCPQCRIWHHQSEEMPCWTYAPLCALCPQPTPLDAGYRWSPEDL
jgi:hypothetical protein